MRCPRSPGQGTESSPGSSFWNFTHLTLRPLVLVEARVAGDGADGPQESAMKTIVVDLAGREHRQCGVDREHQTGMRGAERLLDERRPRRAREDESEIARAFGQWHQQLIRFRGD